MTDWCPESIGVNTVWGDDTEETFPDRFFIEEYIYLPVISEDYLICVSSIP